MKQQIVKFTREDFRRFTDAETFERIVDVTTVAEFLTLIHSYGDAPAIGAEFGGCLGQGLFVPVPVQRHDGGVLHGGSPFLYLI